MSEKDPNLEGNIDISDLSSLSLDDDSLKNINMNEVESLSVSDNLKETGSEVNNLSDTSTDSSQTSSVVDESVFLDLGEERKKNVLNDKEHRFSTYLRWFFFSSFLILLGILAIVILYSFDIYVKQFDKSTKDDKYQGYVQIYEGKYRRIKSLIGFNGSYETPIVGSPQETLKVNEIINAKDIDYMEKKDLLSIYVSSLVSRVHDRADYVENIKQEIAKQGFLPEELETLLSEDQAIDMIQRSLNALEVIKFSTAAKVFSYMDTALTTISEMIRISGTDTESLKNLFMKISSRGEKDVSAYVYMCYLNPFEVSADCDAVGDLDLYYDITKDKSIDIRLFKNSMNAISQLLEKEDTTLFTITFNGFNAKDKNIEFEIEVYTNQEDERALLQQGKKNPNIFILTNIVNLLKQSSFIIGAKINTKEVNIEQKTIDLGNISRNVNYSTMKFVVPIQKNTEREIFDYIDLESMKNLLSDRGFKQSDEVLEDLVLDDKEENDIEGYKFIDEDLGLKSEETINLNEED